MTCLCFDAKSDAVVGWPCDGSMAEELRRLLMIVREMLSRERDAR